MSGRLYAKLLLASQEITGMYGKVFGALLGVGLGLWLHSPSLAALLGILGAALGHGLDHWSASSVAQAASSSPLDLPEPRTREEIDAEAQAQFAKHLCALFVAVARVDGELTAGEVRAVREFFEKDLRFTYAQLEWVRRFLKESNESPPEVEAAAQSCARALTEAERLLLLNALFSLVSASRTPSPAELAALEQAHKGLGLSAEDWRAMFAMHFGESGQHYARLGLEPGASEEVIRRAYRRLAAECHPDRVAHLGPGAVGRAHHRFLEISAAYDALRSLRGF